MSLPSVLRTFALSDTMCPPVPVTIAPTFSSFTSSTVTSTLTVLPVPKNSAESGISTQLQVSPLTSTPIVASKLFPAAAMPAPYLPARPSRAQPSPHQPSFLPDTTPRVMSTHVPPRPQEGPNMPRGEQAHCREAAGLVVAAAGSKRTSTGLQQSSLRVATSRRQPEHSRFGPSSPSWRQQPLFRVGSLLGTMPTASAGFI